MAFDIEQVPGGGKLKSWWEIVPSERKRVYLLMAIFAALLIASAFIKKPAAPVQNKQNLPKLDMTVVTPPRRDEGVQELRAKVDSMSSLLSSSNKKMEDLTRQIMMLKEGNQQAGNTQVGELARELSNVREEVRTYKSDILSGPSPARNLPIPDLPPPPEEKKIEVPPPRKPKIRIIDGDGSDGGDYSASPNSLVGETKSQSGAAKSEVKGKDGVKLARGETELKDSLMEYIPSGTIINGVLLNGIIAPTSSLAQKQPVPALMRVKTLAFLPNRVTQDIQECHIIVSGYGVLSTERVNMRTETISCVRNDGGVIESPLDGFAVGEDGSQGLRGTLVTKQGALIARALVSGFISGFSNIMKPSAIAGISTSPGSLQQWQTPDVSSALTSGALGGISQASNDISKFYLDTAKEMHPVVEVPSLTPVTIILVQGTQLAVGKPQQSAAAAGRKRRMQY